MIPVGYMAKYIAPKPESWLPTSPVQDIYSVSGCITNDFADYISYWRHNGYWLFDSPAIIQHIATSHAFELSGSTLFYYEVYELEFDEMDRRWHPFGPQAAFTTHVVEPVSKQIEGYDVVTFEVGNSPECSPLSCNALAELIKTNTHCLLSSFDEARQLLEAGAFDRSEPGPFRIFAVYSVSSKQ